MKPTDVLFPFGSIVLFLFGGGGVDVCFTSHIWFGCVPIKETIFNCYISSHSEVLT